MSGPTSGAESSSLPPGVLAAVEAQRGGIDRCILFMGATGGELCLSWRVRPGTRPDHPWGSAEDLRLVTDTTRRWGLGSCVLDAAARFRFPPELPGTEVTWTFEVDPARLPAEPCPTPTQVSTAEGPDADGYREAWGSPRRDRGTWPPTTRPG